MRVQAEFGAAGVVRGRVGHVGHVLSKAAKYRHVCWGRGSAGA